MDINTIEMNKDAILAAWPNLSNEQKIALFKKIGETHNKELTLETFKVIGQSFIPVLTSLPSFKALEQKEMDNMAMGKAAKVKFMYSYRTNDNDIETSFQAKPSEYKEFASMDEAIEFASSYYKSSLHDDDGECYYLDDKKRKVFVALCECWIDEVVDDESGIVSEMEK